MPVLVPIPLARDTQPLQPTFGPKIVGVHQEVLSSAVFDRFRSVNRTGRALTYLMSFFRNALLANFQKLQLSLILTVGGQILQTLQISAVIGRIPQNPREPANYKSKFQFKKLAKVCSKKFLLSSPDRYHQFSG